MLTLLDIDHNGALSVSEMRKGIRAFFTARTAQDQAFDLNGDATVNRIDLLGLIASIKAFRIASCGNGIVEAAEQCDDGGIANADGCSAQCRIESGFTCTGLQPSVCQPRQGSGAVLTANDFSYAGLIKIPQTKGQPSGLAYRAGTNTWFTISTGGTRPYELLVFSLPNTPSTSYQSAPQATLIRNWGNIADLSPALNLSGSLQRMKGLYWDEAGQRLWFNYGSFYAVQKHFPTFGYLTFENNQMQMHGPWCVSFATHSDRVKGMMIEAPPELQAITGERFLMFGVTGSTSQQQSWGIGLTSVAEPSAALPPAVRTLILWDPQRVKEGEGEERRPPSNAMEVPPKAKRR